MRPLPVVVETVLYIQTVGMGVGVCWRKMVLCIIRLRSAARQIGARFSSCGFLLPSGFSDYLCFNLGFSRLFFLLFGHVPREGYYLPFFFFFLVLVDLMLVAHVGTDCGRHLSRRLFGFVSVGVGVLWCVCAAVWVL